MRRGREGHPALKEEKEGKEGKKEKWSEGSVFRKGAEP
jgi:hypothetical protein